MSRRLPVGVVGSSRIAGGCRLRSLRAGLGTGAATVRSIGPGGGTRRGGSVARRRRRAVRVDRGSGRVARGDRGRVARPGAAGVGAGRQRLANALDRPPAGCGLESAGEGETAIGRTGVGVCGGGMPGRSGFARTGTVGSEHVRLSTRRGWRTARGLRRAGPSRLDGIPGTRRGSGRAGPGEDRGVVPARAVRGSVPTRRRPGSGADPGSRRPWRARRPVPGGCRAWQRAPRTSPDGRPVRRPGDRSLR